MTKAVKIKDVLIGGGNKIAVQSMLNCDTIDCNAVFKQISDLESERCDIIRLAVENLDAVTVCKKYLNYGKAPLVADIHFDYAIAVACSDIGFPKIRINPSNIELKARGINALNEVVAACKRNKTVIRIGVNAGSLENDLLLSYGVSAKSLSLSALRAVEKIEKLGFNDLVVSVKASDIKTTIEANRLISQSCNYPLHIGVTESGGKESGGIKSAIGIGSLLNDSIGDTIRVSLTADPVEEVKLARQILKALNKIEHCQVISCPTCSRCKYDLFPIAREISDFVKDIEKNIKVAVMGCAVNGPGEARNADVGVAGAGKNAVIFKKGEIVKTIPFDEVVPQLKLMITEILNENSQN